MRKNGRILWACVLSVLMACCPATASFGASETETEENRQTTESPQKVLSDIGDAVGSVLSKGYENTVSIDAEEPLTNLLSDAIKGTDMSWLENITLTGASCGNEDSGVDASGVISLNGTELYHGRVSVDADDLLVYISCPEFRKTPAVVDLKKIAGMEDADSKDTGGEDTDAGGKDESASFGEFRSNYAMLAGEAGNLLTSLTEEDIEKFARRYADVFLENAAFTYHENVTVMAGALSENISTTTVTVDQSGMASILDKSIDTLKEDQLISKVLASDFACDLTNTVRQAMKYETYLGSDQIYEGYLSLLAFLEKEDFSQVPGFSLTYGYDSHGQLAHLEFSLLYSGAAAKIFSIDTLQTDTHLSAQFDLGDLISALIAKYWKGDSNGTTGILIEADKASDVVHDSFLVMVAGQEIASVYLDNFQIQDLQEGVVEGLATLKIGDSVYTAQFTHPQQGTEIITGKYNDTEYLKITAEAQSKDDPKVDRIKREKAMPVYDQSTWDAYIKDAKLAKMIDQLPKAGVPDSIMEMLTSGEAGTEKSRENTDEVDGTAEMKNGEVGGADIGEDKGN